MLRVVDAVEHALHFIAAEDGWQPSLATGTRHVGSKLLVPKPELLAHASDGVVFRRRVADNFSARIDQG
jgi:hypothetical protein